MKKLFFAACLVVLGGTGLKAQILNIDNQTPCEVFVDFYCRDASCGINYVSTSGAIIPPSTPASYDAAAMYLSQYGSTIPAGYSWQYGLIGQGLGCTPQAPGGGCTGSHIQMSAGICALPALSSGCVNVDASCNLGCSSLNVTAVFHTNGDCDLTIN